ncbi:hypothetical protein C4571_01880 [Candidatus Parcubacteria bacterium]|nr:MAG: hypothetical protein C4571_01880 [Candidatus Parcubacteria bacterium]
MKYDIYFHDDFDGAASAAIMLSFLKSRGDSVARLQPVNFGMKRKWPEQFKFRNPSVVLDFPYHPRATFWYDHHPTTFLKPEWQKNFKETPFQRFDVKYPSCCGLVLDALRRGFGFRPPKHQRELVRWGDIIDKADYASPRQAVEMRDAAIQLNAFIDEHARKKGFFDWLVPLLSEKSIRYITQTRRFRTSIRTIRRKQETTIRFYRKHLTIEGPISYIDLSGTKFRKISIAPYYLCPELIYSVTLKQDGRFFHLNVAANPWRRSQNILEIGKILRNHGGGGHKDVGGAEFRTHHRAEVAVQSIMPLLHRAAQKTSRK